MLLLCDVWFSGISGLSLKTTHHIVEALTHITVTTRAVKIIMITLTLDYGQIR